jgi:hypothetical protein
MICLFGRLFDIFIQMIVNTIARFFGSSVAFFFSNVLTFIGVVHHELSHALFAFITGAKIMEIKLFTLNGGDSLGHVKFAPRGNWLFQSIQLCLASIAPMVTGFISLWLLYQYYLVSSLSGVGLVLFFYVCISILLHMRLSRQDISVALKGLPVCFVLLVVFFCVTRINMLSYLYQILGV